ncbi:MAG: TetR/AcrR family transcriptional regulator [Bradymonadia bacterium]
MGRPSGTRNPGYADRRERLIEGMIPIVLSPGRPLPSFRQLAESAGVSVPTLRHYFGDQEGALRSIFEFWSDRSQPYLDQVASETDQTFEDSLWWSADFLIKGWRMFGVGRIHATGIELGLGHTTRGPGYLDGLYEPLQQALEARMRHHMNQGHLREGEPRVMALCFLSPLLMALLHQDELGGHACRPLDFNLFLREHIDGFMRGWGA